MPKQVYIAGPMSGLPNWNYDNFNRVAYEYSRKGWTVKNPAAKDVEMGYDDKEAITTGDTQLSISNGSFDYKESYLWDVTQIIEGDAIFMLKGWEKSMGARGEHAVACAMKNFNQDFQIFYE